MPGNPIPPWSQLQSRWRHEWRWGIRRVLFERRHVRHLGTLALLLLAATIFLTIVLLAVGVALGGTSLIWDRAFAQSLLASIATLPLGVALGVIIATVLQKYSLRFQARHAGDRLADRVSYAAFSLIVDLARDYAMPISLEGPTNHQFVRRARESIIQHMAKDDHAFRFPPEYQAKLDTTTDRLISAFREAPDLRIAFPRAFDLIERLEPLLQDIRTESNTSSGLENTTLIVLHFAAEIQAELA